MNTKLYLASKSPRRQELLNLMGYSFEMLLKDVDESYPGDLALTEVAAFIADKKAAAIDIPDDGILITADTIVLINDEILGKPTDETDAITMIGKLAGRKHQVITGVSVRSAVKQITFSEETLVYFNPLSLDEISYYVKNHKPFDKAGAYGIQDWIGLVAVNRIEGSYTNVMGLPTDRLRAVLKKEFSW
ncbi:septum formation protein Maf [Pedobacter glucosidilyticus]|nr:Maf family nucleotide pyrophosphatase [Pedobacter glucosidilyticus]KHJ37491.1 septum formation protein Maf [Pedobacter glucosidilyticus]